MKISLLLVFMSLFSINSFSSVFCLKSIEDVGSHSSQSRVYCNNKLVKKFIKKDYREAADNYLKAQGYKFLAKTHETSVFVKKGSRYLKAKKACFLVKWYEEPNWNVFRRIPMSQWKFEGSFVDCGERYTVPFGVHENREAQEYLKDQDVKLVHILGRLEFSFYSEWDNTKIHLYLEL